MSGWRVCSKHRLYKCPSLSSLSTGISLVSPAPLVRRTNVIIISPDGETGPALALPLSKISGQCCINSCDFFKFRCSTANWSSLLCNESNIQKLRAGGSPPPSSLIKKFRTLHRHRDQCRCGRCGCTRLFEVQSIQLRIHGGPHTL